MNKHKTFLLVHLLVGVLLLMTFVICVGLIAGGSVSVDHDFAGNSWLNPVEGKTYHLETLILALISGAGLLIQGVSLNRLYILEASKPNV